jgi:DNA (cytosine-5)-methyltransferase 1
MGLSEPVAMCEIAPYPRSILAKRYPMASLHEDVTTLRASDVGHVEAVVGGFPCQDISNANPEGRGLDGGRSGLWFEMLRLIKETRCDYVVAENVSALQRKGLNVVAAGLEAAGYYVEATRVAASDAGHPHRRHRLLILAYRAGIKKLSPQDELGGRWTRIRGDWSGTVPRYSEDSGVMWPTPTVHGNRNRVGVSAKSGDGLLTSVKRALSLPIGERCESPLNPAWVEALMGWPIGWTDVDCDSPLAIPGPVMGRGTAQHDWEPPRMVKAREMKGRPARIKACGNGVVRGLGAIAKARAESVMSGRS